MVEDLPECDSVLISSYASFISLIVVFSTKPSVRINTNLRKYLLLTLSRANKTREGEQIDKDEIRIRILKVMKCTTIIVTTWRTRASFPCWNLSGRKSTKCSTPSILRKAFLETSSFWVGHN